MRRVEARDLEDAKAAIGSRAGLPAEGRSVAPLSGRPSFLG